jgi:DNA-binding NtrC family response regulator
VTTQPAGRPDAAPRIRVLVAARDPAIARGLLEMLEAIGMEVHQGEPQGAVQGGADLATIDILLLETSAFGDAEWALVERVREGSPMVEIVAVSADLAVENAVTAVRAGVYTVLGAPVTPGALVAAIRSAHDRKRRGEQRIQVLNGERRTSR